MLSRIISNGISLVTLPIITRYLEPESFGIIALFVVESVFLAGLYDLGLNAFAGRMVFKYHHKNPERCRQYLGVMLFFITLSSLAGLVITLPLARFINLKFIGEVNYPNIFVVYCPLITAFLTAVNGFCTNNLINLHQNKRSFVIEIFYTIFLIPPQIVGLIWFGFTWVEIVYVYLFARLIVTVISLVMMRDNLAFSFKRLRIWTYALRYSLPLLPLNFSAWIQEHIDKIFLSRIYSVSSVGIYSVGAKLCNVFAFCSRPVMATVKPEISKRLDNRDRNIDTDITDFFNLFFQGALFLVFAVSIFSQEIVHLIADESYGEAFIVVPFLLISYLLSELTGVFQLKFIYKNKTALLPVFVFLGAFLNALLNFVLIPRFYIVGAAFATVLSNLLIFFCCYIVAQKFHYSRYDLKGNFLITILVTVAIGVIQNFIPHSMTMGLVRFMIILGYAMILMKYLFEKNRIFKGIMDVMIKPFQLKTGIFFKKLIRLNS